MDLELARADGRLDPVPVAARLLERSRHGRLAHAEEPQHAPSRRSRPLQQLPHRLAGQRVRPEPPQLARRAGQDDHDAARRRPEDESRSRAREADGDRRSRPCRLLRHTGREVPVRPPQALRNRAGDRLDLLLERLVHDELEPGCARDQLHRAIVVRRPETAGDEARVRLQPLTEGSLELGRRVSDDRDPGRLEPVAQRLGGEERAVPVGALAADELTAGDDDDRARPLAHPRRRVVRFGVTRTRRLCTAGSATARPSRVTRRPAGRAHEEVEAAAWEPVRLSRFHRSLQVDLAGGPAAAHLDVGPAADAVQDELAGGRRVAVLLLPQSRHVRRGAGDLPGSEDEDRHEHDRRRARAAQRGVRGAVRASGSAASPAAEAARRASS